MDTPVVATQQLDNLGEITSEEELLAQIGGKASTNGTANEGEGGEGGEAGTEGSQAGEEGTGQEGSENYEGGEGEEGTSSEEFANIVDYLNRQYELGLAVDQLPKDLTREQEAEIVADLFDRTAKGAQRKLSEYGEIERLLKEDAELAEFIKAKREGKNLRDFLKEYAGSTDGMDDETVIRSQLQAQYPEMTEEEISDMLTTYKDKGVLEKMAKSARNLLKEQEALEARVQENRSLQDYQKEVNNFGNLVQNTSAVYEIPLTDEMKKNVFVAATQRDEEGLTYLDRALQSNEGVFLATLGLLHMQDLIRAKASVDTNRRNKKLVDKLFESPSDLQSSSQQEETTKGFDPNAANAF